MAGLSDSILTREFELKNWSVVFLLQFLLSAVCLFDLCRASKAMKNVREGQAT
jgi:hypothetical protein